MKSLKIFIATLLLTGSAYTQTFTIRDNFSDVAPRDSIIGRTGFKWAHTPGWVAGDRYAINSDATISPYNPTSATAYAGTYWDSTLTSAAGVISGFTIKQEDNGTGYRYTFLYLTNDTLYSSAGIRGYLAIIRYGHPTLSDVIELAQVTGAFTYVGIAGTYTNTTFAANDTILFKWYAGGTRKTLEVRHANGARDSCTTTDQAYDQANLKFMMRSQVAAGVGVKYDDFTLQAVDAGTPPVTDVVSAQIASINRTPAAWDITTPGVISARVTDDFAVDSIKIRFRAVGGAWGDSVAVRCGDAQTDTTVYFNVSPKAAGSYEWQVYVDDSAGNAGTTSATQSFTVGTAGQYRGLIVTIPLQAIGTLAQEANNPVNGNNTVTNPANWDFSQIDVFIHFKNAVITSQVSGQYWLPQIQPTEPPINISAATNRRYYEDFNLEYNVGHSGQTTFRFRKQIRDSLNAHGGKMLLNVDGLAGTGDNDLTYICQDSTRTQAFTDSLMAYVRGREYDGVCLNWEFPGSADKNNYSRLRRRLRARLNEMTPPGMLVEWGWKAGNNSASLGVDVQSVNENTDVFMPMLYGYGNNIGTVGHNAPIYNETGCNIGEYIHQDGPRSWMAAGMDSDKIAMTFAGEIVSRSQTNAVICAPRTSSSTFNAYRQAVAAEVANPSLIRWSEASKVPWITVGNTMYSYDNPRSYDEKAKYGQSIGLKWMSVWDAGRGLLPNPPAGHTYNELLDALAPYRSGAVAENPDTLLPPPTLVSPIAGVTTVNPATDVLKWRKVTGATSYNVSLYRQGARPTDPVVYLLQTSTSDTTVGMPAVQMVPGITYYWQISTINGAGQGANGAPETFQMAYTVVSAPSTPTLVLPTANATSQTSPLTFKWNRADSATAYSLHIVLGIDTNNSTVILSTTTAETSYVLTATLSYSTVYHWKVASFNPGGGYSGYSAYRKLTTSDAPNPALPLSTTQILAKGPGETRGSFREFDGMPLREKSANSVRLPDTSRVEIFFNTDDAGKPYYKTWRGGAVLPLIGAASITSSEIIAGWDGADKTLLSTNQWQALQRYVAGIRTNLITTSSGTAGVAPLMLPGYTAVLPGNNTTDFGSTLFPWRMMFGRSLRADTAIVGGSRVLTAADTLTGNIATLSDITGSGTNLGDGTPDRAEANLTIPNGVSLKLDTGTITAQHSGATQMTMQAGNGTFTMTGSGGGAGIAFTDIISGHDNTGIRIRGTDGVDINQGTPGERMFRVRTVATNDDPGYQQWAQRTTTTDATPTMMFQLALDSAYANSTTFPDTATYIVTTTIIGSWTGGAAGALTDGCVYKYVQAYRTATSTTAQIGSTTTVIAAETQAGFDASVAISGAYIQTTVTGITNYNMTWHVMYDISFVNN